MAAGDGTGLLAAAPLHKAQDPPDRFQPLLQLGLAEDLLLQNYQMRT